MKTRTILLAASAVLLAASPPLLAQERVTLPASRIASISPPGDSLTERTLLKFDLPAKLSDVTIDYAVLRFKAAPSFSEGVFQRLSLVVHPISSSWNENATWSGGWTNAGGDFLQNPSIWHAVSGRSSNVVEALVTEIIQDWVDGEYQNHGLIVMSTTEGLSTFDLTNYDGLETDELAELVIWYTKRE